MTQRVSNSRVRDRLGFSQSGSGLGSVCTLASGSAGFGFFVGFLYLDLSQQPGLVRVYVENSGSGFGL